MIQNASEVDLKRRLDEAGALGMPLYRLLDAWNEARVKEAALG